MIEIRRMEQSEAKEVKKIAQKAFIGIERFFVNNPKEAMVAVNNGKIVGGIIIKRINSGGNRIGYFDTAFVDSSYHDKGIGAKLYEATTKYLWQEGCTAQSALVKDDNVGSWKLFLNNGFTLTTFGEGVRTLGLKTMLIHYFTTPYLISNGMEFYLTSKEQQVKPKKNSSLKAIGLYILINILLMMVRMIMNPKDFPIFMAAYITLLVSNIIILYFGTLFTKRKWNFRLNGGGAALVAGLNLLGGIFPMVGNWYPEKYEKTKELKRDMGFIEACGWIGLIGIAVVAFVLSEKHRFLYHLAAIGAEFLIYRIIIVYPMDIFGGRRVYLWNKTLYTILALLSTVMIWIILF